MGVRAVRICVGLVTSAVAGAAAAWPQASSPGAGSQPPRILDLDLSTDNHSRVFVRWTTNEPTTWTLDWGELLPLPRRISGDAPKTSHGVMLRGLGGSLIRITLRAKNVLGVPSIPFNAGFDPDNVRIDDDPPVLTDVRIHSDAIGDATLVLWRADEPVVSTLEYGLTTEYSVQSSTGMTFGEIHSTVLTDLLSATEYHLRLSVTDVFGNTTTTADQPFLNGSSHDQIIEGSRTTWFPITLDLPGPQASETDTNPNPFLDYRMAVLFTGPAGQRYVVPGYFDGDGEGGGTGNVWRAKFPPDEAGTWNYLIQFVGGPNISIDLNPYSGTHLPQSGAFGEFEVLPRRTNAPGFHKYGRLEHVGEHHLKARDGPYFIKTGTDSPENFLGFAGFDNTVDQGGHPISLLGGLHRYPDHVKDWGPTGLGDDQDPYFVSADSGVDSKGIVGAINYLSSVGVNAIYFLPMNLGGDGQETSPFVGFTNDPYNDTHYDISKLYQWGQVFDHATRRGLLLHFVLAESELQNRTWLDNGVLGIERRLFFREMVSRFGHALGLVWNLCEESAFYNGQMIGFANYLKSLDPYNHPIGFHTITLPPDSTSSQFDAVLGNDDFSMNSIQSNIGDVGDHIEYWRASSAAAGRKWMVSIDEITGGLSDVNASEYRRRALFDVLFSGGNIEFYFGTFSPPLGGDLSVEDFRTREEMWQYCFRARTFMEENLPFWEMEPADHLVVGEIPFSDGGGAEVLAQADDTYAIYFPTGEDPGSLDLTDATGSFTKRWWMPETGNFEGSAETIQGGSLVDLGSPPFYPLTDWVCLVQR
jgi:hypothetical protein